MVSPAMLFSCDKGGSGTTELVPGEYILYKKSMEDL